MANTSSAIFQQLLVKLRGEMGLALTRTFAARGIAAVGSVVLVAAIGRLYGVTGVGVYALAQSILIAASILGRFGMDGALMRYVGRDVNSGHVAAYLRYALIRTALLSLLIALGMYATRFLWSQGFNTPDLAAELTGFAIATPAFTLAYILSGFMKAIRKPAAAMLLQNGGVAFLAALLVLLFYHVDLGSGAASIGMAFACAAWLVLAIGLWHCRFWFKHGYSPVETSGQPDIEGFQRLSVAVLVSGSSRMLVEVGSFWIAGTFLSAATVGLFKAAQQVSNLIRVIQMVINAIFPPRFAALYHQGKHKALAALARRGVLLALLLAVVPTLICLLVPGLVLEIFGNDFARAKSLLRILAAAQLVNITCGSVGQLLNMSGHEHITRNVNLIVNFGCCAFMLLLTPVWGILAVVLGIAFNFIVTKLIFVYFVWARMGIWTLPTSIKLRPQAC